MTNGISVEDRLVDVPGGRVFVRSWRNAGSDSSPLILLHDSLGCVELWGPFPRALSEVTGRTVTAYDRLGFGRSTPRRELPSANFVREEAEIYFPPIASALRVSEFCLFGHSVGGGMAITIASVFERCTAVVSEYAQALVESKTIEGIERAVTKFRSPGAMAKLQRLHGDKAEWVFRAWVDVWTSPGFRDWSLETALLGVNCPLLVIHGDLDEYASLGSPQTIHRLSAGPSRMEMIPDCGHVPHREEKDVVLNLTAKFLSGID
jgi:pimeloyl-ACP methyl ester carboxylesterase